MTRIPTRLTRPRLTAVLGLLVLAGITWVRLTLVGHLPDQGFFAKYTLIAADILAGRIPFDRVGDLSPAYLWAVTAGLGPLGLDLTDLRVAQIMAVSLAAGACGLAAWRRWGPAPGIAAAVVLLTSRAALVNATEIEPETLILLSAAIGLSLIVAVRRPAALGVAGGFLALAALTRPSALLPAGLAMIGLVVNRPPGRSIPRSVLPVLLGFGLLFAGARLAMVIALDAPPTSMNPGTVLSEGWNPMATGYLGEAPAVVKDVEHGLHLPDGLHVAYRLVAARALGRDPSPIDANAFWGGKALAFARHEPVAALRLAVRKVALALHSYDAWDLLTQFRKSEMLPSWLFVPFGFVIPWAIFGALTNRRDPAAAALGLWAIGSVGVMTAFYVTARQRNIILPAVALLAGLAVRTVIDRWRSGEKRWFAVVVALGLLTGGILTHDGAAQVEDRHGWILLEAQEALSRETALDPGLRTATAATFLDPEALATANPQAVFRSVRAQLASQQPPERLFDLALALLESGRPADAEPILVHLDDQGYRPRRGARWTSSTAYHRARCRLAAGDRAGALDLIRRAVKQAPGDPRILALQSMLLEREGTSQAAAAIRMTLDALVDPFTANRALARAHRDLGDLEAARSRLAENRRRLPEWNPRTMR